jgi:hypothetical protein
MNKEYFLEVVGIELFVSGLSPMATAKIAHENGLTCEWDEEICFFERKFAKPVYITSSEVSDYLDQFSDLSNRYFTELGAEYFGASLQSKKIIV